MPPGLVKDCTLQDLEMLYRKAQKNPDVQSSDYESSEWEEELHVNTLTRKKIIDILMRHLDFSSETEACSRLGDGTSFVYLVSWIKN